MVAISSNDVEQYPRTAPQAMAAFAAAHGYTFPYLYDETQAVARAYHAACTPDFFLFDAERRLVYRGQLDGARPANDVPVTGATSAPRSMPSWPASRSPEPQLPSLGCNIKWKAGSAPAYTLTR